MAPKIEHFKKRIGGLAALVLGAGLVLAPSPAGSLAQQNQQNAAEYSQPKRENVCTPHYLKGVKRPEDPLENMLEKYRAYGSMKMKYPSEPGAFSINGSIELERKIHGINAALIFPNYVKQENGEVRHYHAAGVVTYSTKEFECIVEDNVNYISQAAKLTLADYEGMLPAILEAQEKKLKDEGLLKEDEKLEDYLDKDVPGYEGLKVRDVLLTPDVTIQDIIPTRYYFGDIDALGVSYTDSGIVGIDPKARVLDYITGVPVTLMHEMTHRSQKLQHSPLMYKVDAELWASFPELGYEDILHFIYHPYLKDVRKVAKTLFNFDSYLAEADITYLDTMMGIEFEKEKNHQKLREYIKKVADISKAVKEVAFKLYLPEFYTQPLHFITLNEFLKDDNVTFKLMMYSSFEPTLLGGPEKTRDFIQENENIFEKLAREVIWDLKSKRNGLDDDELLKIKKTLEERLHQMAPARKKALMRAAQRFGMPGAGDLNKEVIEFGLRLYRLGIVDFDEENEEVMFK